jgi:hypothetical protein
MEEKRKEREEENARRKTRKRSRLLVPLLLVLCVAIWTAPSLLLPREPVLSQETLEQGAKVTLYLASIGIKGSLDTHKSLRLYLAQVGIDSAGIEYVRSANSVFELSMRVQGTRLLYRSTLPDSVFLGPNLRIRGIS